MGISLKDWDEEVFKGIAHPCRRGIIEYLHGKGESSFSELLKNSKIANHGKIGFHLRALGGLVERGPSGKRYRLTEKGRLAEELIRDFRFLLAGHGRDTLIEPGRYVRDLGLGDHAVLYYNTDEVKREVCFPFLKAGLLGNESCLYLVAESKLDSEEREIRGFGIEVASFPEGAFAVASAEDWYLKKGNARTDTIIANWMRLLREKQRAGFSGLRVAGETSVFFDYAKSEELLRYEAAVQEHLDPNMCALCLYDASRPNEKEFLKLNRSHSHALLEGLSFLNVKRNCSVCGWILNRDGSCPACNWKRTHVSRQDLESYAKPAQEDA